MERLVISNEQIKESLRYLRETGGRPVSVTTAVSPEQLSRIKAHLQRLPDVREATVLRLKGAVAAYEIEPEAIASKMIGRAIADMVR